MKDLPLLAESIGWVSMASVAPLLGLKSAQTVRDWCRRRSVPYYRDGKRNMLRIVDIKAALSKLEASNDTHRATVVNDSVISMMRRKGRR